VEENSKRLQLNAKQSTNLLRLGLDCGQDGMDHAKADTRADLLADTLGSRMPVDAILLESLPAVLRSLSEQLESVSGLPLGQLLLSPKTKVAVLRRIKDYAKDMGASASDESRRDVALAVYYAAIAAAIVHHNVRISQHAYDKLVQSFDKLSTNDWVSPDMARLFRKAREHCTQKA
jgi:hypothetical protein